MICPFCRNKGFEPGPEMRNPVINIGPTEQFNSGTVRRYTCLNCGKTFKSQEKLLGEIKINKNQCELFMVRRKVDNESR